MVVVPGMDPGGREMTEPNWAPFRSVCRRLFRFLRTGLVGRPRNVVLVKGERSAHRVFESLCCFVEKRLGLEVNREKSAVRPAKELSYLGFSFRRKKVVVSEDSLSDFKYRLKELSSRNWSVSMCHRLSSSLSSASSTKFDIRGESGPP